MEQAIIKNKSMELTIEQLLQRGIDRHQEGKLKEAELTYRVILKHQPNHPVANHNLGVIAVSMNNSGLALPFFKVAIETNPKIEQFWVSYIDALIKNKKFVLAKQVLADGEKIVLAGEHIDFLKAKLNNVIEVEKQYVQKNDSIKPSQEQINKLLKCYQNGRYIDAEQLALSITEQFPENQFSWKVLGAILKQTGRTSEALHVNKRTLQLDPNDPEAHNNLGVTFQDLGILEDAESSYKQAIILKCDFSQAHYNLGIIQKKLGKLEEAEVSYKQAIAHQSGFAAAHTNLGNTLQELGRLEEAEASHRQAIAMKVDYAEAYNNLGVTLQELGRLEEAEANFRQAIVLRSNFAEAYNNLGVTLQDLGRLEEAEVSYRKAIELKTNFAEGYKNLGKILQCLDRLEESEASYRQALAIQSDYSQAYDELGVTQQLLGKFEEAEKNYKKFISLDPLSKPVTASMGNILFRKGEFEGALNVFDSYNTKDSRSRAIECLYSLKRIDEIYHRLDVNAELDDVNLKIASFASFIAEEQHKQTAHRFCKKPLDFLYFSSLSLHTENLNSFITKVIEDLKDIPSSWQPPVQSLKKGFKTNGDLFRFPKENINALKKIILKEIDTYYEKFKNKKCSFIEKWPDKKNISGWHVILKEQGYHNLHIHPSGWLSGVIYLKVVPSLSKNEGAIQFDVGGKFSDVSYSKITHNPKVGDIIFFPSSLYHRTIPFSTDNERVIVSFDLSPKEY